ncbi:hypothetical protein D3C80_940860 [compost metagenome]
MRRQERDTTRRGVVTHSTEQQADIVTRYLGIQTGLRQHIQVVDNQHLDFIAFSDQAIQVSSQRRGRELCRVKAIHPYFKACFTQTSRHISRSFFNVDHLFQHRLTGFVLLEILVDPQQVIRDFVLEADELNQWLTGNVTQLWFVEQAEVNEQRQHKARLKVVLQTTDDPELTTLDGTDLTEHPVDRLPTSTESTIRREQGLQCTECIFQSIDVREVHPTHLCRMVHALTCCDIRFEALPHLCDFRDNVCNRRTFECQLVVILFEDTGDLLLIKVSRELTAIRVNTFDDLIRRRKGFSQSDSQCFVEVFLLTTGYL